MYKILTIVVTFLFEYMQEIECVDFAGKVIGIIGRQKQRAKCCHNRSKFKQGGPSQCLFHVATQTEKDQYTLIEQSAHLVLTLYSYITSS